MSTSTIGSSRARRVREGKMANRQSTEKGPRKLLRTILSDTEWNQFYQTGNPDVAGQAVIYRFRTSGLSQVLDSGSRRLVTTTRLPPATAASARDRVIADYLLIRNDENVFWQTAYISPE